MNRTLKVLATFVGAGALALGLSACSTPSTAADEIAVHRGGGPFEGKTDKECVPASSREVNSAFDGYFYYPSNQRTYDFVGDKDSDAKPITVVSKDNQTLSIPGQINFELNTDCKVLKAFHDNIGNRYQAYGTDSGQLEGEGWSKMLNLYIGRAADATMDRVAKQYTWRELYSDPAIKDTLNQKVNEEIQRLVNQQTDGDQVFFQNFQTLVNQPQPSQELVKALQTEESAKANAAATEVKAKADATAAENAAKAQVATKTAELKVAQLEAAILQAEINAHGGPALYNEWLIANKGLNPRQPTYGGNTIVDPK